MKNNFIYNSGVLSNGELASRATFVSLSKIILNNVDTLSSQLTDQNCEYVILYNFNLNSDSITIPNNCTLNFQGGSITGGTITLQNTKLEGDVKWTGTTISGSCANDILTPQIFGAYPSVIEDETNKTQHTLAFENLARVIKNQNTISKTVYISGGHYAINKKINIESDCKLYGDGNVTILDLYEGKGGLYFGKSSGVSEALNCTITQDVSKFDTNIIVDDTSELSAGDFIVLVDTVDGSFNNSRAYHRTCECLKVKKIQNNTVYFDSMIYGDYYVDYGTGETTSLTPTPAHRTVISKFYPNVYLISDINIYSHEHENVSPQTYYSLQIKGFYDSEFNNISVENHGNSVSAAISLGVNYKVDHSSFRNFATYTGDAYGLVINSSQNFYVSSSTFRADSHALATGGGSGLTALINRNFIYDNLFFETSEKFNSNLEEIQGHIDCDVHANAEYYKFINISAPHTSCDTGGYNVVIEGCKFYAIWPSFNQGDFSIRKCELFGENGNMLFSNADRQNYNGHNSVIIEDCIIHEFLRLDFQDSNLNHEYFDFLVLKNNIIHKSIEVRYGRIDFISLDNNIFTNGSFSIPHNTVTANNVSIKNNVFQNGKLFLGLVGTDGLADGVINGNTIILKETRLEFDAQYVLSLYGFRGNVTNNVIMSYVDDNYELISVSSRSDIQVFDNFLQKGVGSTTKAMIISIGKSNVICERNKHNSIRSSIINVTEYSGGMSRAFSDYNNVFTSDSEKWKAFSSTGIIGKLSYIKTDNKILYAGVKEKGSRIASLGVYYQGNTDTAIIDNTLTYGRSYLVNINNSGPDLYSLYFSKYDRDDPEFSENNMVCVLDNGGVGNNYEFKAEDPAEYPYLYATTTASSGVHIFSIYENNIVCEIDGAAYGTLRRGTTAQRPNYTDIYIGFKYWDTDLGKEITYTELTYNRVPYWREYDGAIAGVPRSGRTSQRPTGLYNTSSSPNNAVPCIYEGFRYFDTDLNKEIYAKEIDEDSVTWDYVENITKETNLSSNSDDRVPSSKAVAQYIRDAVSDNIVFSQSALFKARPCSNHLSDVYDNARIKSIQGNTILWDQRINSQTLVTKSYEANTEVAYANCYPLNISFNAISGHVYYVSCLIYSSFGNIAPFRFRRNLKDADAVTCTLTNKYTRYSLLSSVVRDDTSDKVQLFNTQAFTTTEAGTIAVKGTCVIDVTKIFGEGNEPSTTGEFEAWLDRNVGLYDAYKSENKLLSSNLIGLKVIGFNQFNLSTGVAKLIGGLEYEVVGNYTSLTIDGLDVSLTNGKFTPDRNCELTVTGGDSTTCIHLVWNGDRDGEYEEYSEQIKSIPVSSLTGKLNGRGTSVTIFSDGLKKYSEDVYDEIIIENGTTKAVKRVGSRAYNSETDSELLNDGTTTYYALEIPETYVIDDFSLPVRYSCDEYSTEEVIFPNSQNGELTSCSPTLSIVYGDTIDDKVDLISSQIGSQIEELYIYK